MTSERLDWLISRSNDSSSREWRVALSLSVQLRNSFLREECRRRGSTSTLTRERRKLIRWWRQLPSKERWTSFPTFWDLILLSASHISVLSGRTPTSTPTAQSRKPCSWFTDITLSGSKSGTCTLSITVISATLFSSTTSIMLHRVSGYSSHASVFQMER